MVDHYGGVFEWFASRVSDRAGQGQTVRGGHRTHEKDAETQVKSRHIPRPS